MKKFMNSLRIIVFVNTVVLCVLAIYFFILPAGLILHDITDPAIRRGGIPRMAWRVHKAITPGYERWARQRIASGIAGRLNLYDVPSTEWPVFGSVFYLMATENLQTEWEKDPSRSPQAPKVYARKTIEAAKDVILDPGHHTWVKQHWGDDYMRRENVFFRSLIIAGLTSYDRLTGNTAYRDLIKDQCLTLAAALDQSPKGVLNDYPGECYPIDVLGSIAYIKRADALLGIDQSDFMARSIRAFQGRMLDKRGLIPYCVDAETGAPIRMYKTRTPGMMEGPSRGIGNSYILIFAPELWPDRAKEWYGLYEKHFWQDRWGASGWREFPADMPDITLGFDVDAGPIIAGFSPAANAYGVAAARANGRLDHAATLTVQVLSACWPLPDGSLLGPRLLSNPRHAPYLGEVNLLWLLSHPVPADAAAGATAAPVRWPAFVFMATGLCAVIGLLTLGAAVRKWWVFTRDMEQYDCAAPALQYAAWLILIAVAVVLMVIGKGPHGVIGLLLAQMLPRWRKAKKEQTL